MQDPHPLVRQQAVRVSETLLADAPRVAETVMGLANDPDAGVIFEVALILVNGDDPDAGKTLARIARRAPDDPWVRAAVLTSANRHLGALLTTLLSRNDGQPLPESYAEPLFAMAASIRDDPEFQTLLKQLTTLSEGEQRFAPWQFAALAGLQDSLAKEQLTLEAWASADQDRSDLFQRVERLYDEARRLVVDDRAPEGERIQALRVLGRQPSKAGADRDVLGDLLRPQVPSRLQQGAIATLGRMRDKRVPDVLLAGWKAYTPALREQVLDTLLSRREWTAALLSSLEDTCTPPGEIDPLHRRRLLDHPDAMIQSRADAVFAGATEDRSEVIERYRTALNKPGDPSRGAAIFRKTCIACHRLNGEGNEVGPDLASLTDRSPEALLTAILDPNRAFETKYMNYMVETTDGRILSGMIASETATGVSLLQQEGKQHVLLRNEIAAMSSSGQSLMPEGLEKDLSSRRSFRPHRLSRNDGAAAEGPRGESSRNGPSFGRWIDHPSGLPG